MRYCPCPSQEKSDFWSLSGLTNTLAMGIGAANSFLAEPPNHPNPLRDTDSGVLAQPFYNSKKSGWGQTNFPRRQELCSPALNCPYRLFCGR